MPSGESVSFYAAVHTAEKLTLPRGLGLDSPSGVLCTCPHQALVIKRATVCRSLLLTVALV